MAFPDRSWMGSPCSFCVEHGMGKPTLLNPTTMPTLMRFVLPPFQRGEVWTTEQKSKFIESLWMHLPISVYAYNQSPSMGHTDQWLIDGQQRWAAIRDFIANKFTVFDGLIYSDMTEVEDRKFRNTGFPCILIHSDDEAELEEMYNRLAYGGTPHKKKRKKV